MQLKWFDFCFQSKVDPNFLKPENIRHKGPKGESSFSGLCKWLRRRQEKLCELVRLNRL